jgi:hypothetical protein
VKYTFLVSLLFIFPSLLSAETYRWVNDDGVVTFSQSPPPSAEAEKIKLHGGKSSSGAGSQERLNNLRQRLEDNAEDRELKKQAEAEEKKQLALKERNCKAAQSNLGKLQSLGHGLYKTGGEYKRLSEEERQSLMQKEREHIKANCGS